MLVHHGTMAFAFSLFSARVLTDEMIDNAEAYYRQFIVHFARIFGGYSCSINFHLVIHLSECIRKFGPTSVNSCFVFERWNIFVKGVSFNNKEVEKQVMQYCMVRQLLADLMCGVPLMPNRIRLPKSVLEIMFRMFPVVKDVNVLTRKSNSCILHAPFRPPDKKESDRESDSEIEGDSVRESESDSDSGSECDIERQPDWLCGKPVLWDPDDSQREQIHEYVSWRFTERESQKLPNSFLTFKSVVIHNNEVFASKYAFRRLSCVGVNCQITNSRTNTSQTHEYYGVVRHIIVLDVLHPTPDRCLLWIDWFHWAPRKDKRLDVDEHVSTLKAVNENSLYTESANNIVSLSEVEHVVMLVRSSVNSNTSVVIHLQ